MTDFPRVTQEQLKANVKHVEYLVHLTHGGQVLRWAILTTQSGFAVTGRPSVAVHPENDDPEIGMQVAYDNALQELWPLMGYELKARLYVPPTTAKERLKAEVFDLEARYTKLRAFLQTQQFAALDEEARGLLHVQEDQMLQLFKTLSARLFAFKE